MGKRFGWMFMHNKTCIAIALFILSLDCLAQESIATVMARMKPDIAVKILYHETRYMGLFEKEWRGRGYLYAALPNTLIKQQQQPDIEFMGAEGERLTYFKPATASFHQLQFDENDTMMASLAAFKAILTGDLVAIQQHYEVKFNALDVSWTLELLAKYHEAEVEPIKIILWGLNKQIAHKIEIFLPDGDYSRYDLTQLEHGKAVQSEMQALLVTLLSH